MEAASSNLQVLIILLAFVLVSNLLVFPSVGGAQEAQQQNTQTGIAASSEIRAASNNSHGILSSLMTTTTAAMANASSFCSRWRGVTCTDVD
jgi:tetrahydromethanopterin S-methyltransferase subunit D